MSIQRRGVRRFKRGFSTAVFEALERRRLFAIATMDLDGVGTEDLYLPVDALTVSGQIYAVKSPDTDLSGFSVAIDWGDNTQGTGSFVALGDDVYGVIAEHTYAQKGFYGVDLRILETDQMLTQNVPGVITSAGQLENTNTPFDLSRFRERIAWENRDESIRVASFYDRDQLPLDQYTVSVDWGDGTNSTTDQIKLGSGNLHVDDHHAYAEPGIYTLSYTVTRSDGVSLTGARDIEILPPDGVAGVTGEIEVPQSMIAGSTHYVMARFDGDELAGYDIETSRAYISFGDDTQIEAFLSREEDGTWLVSMNHVFAKPGEYNVAVTIQREVGPRENNMYSGIPFVRQGMTGWDFTATKKVTVTAGRFAGEAFTIAKTLDENGAVDLSGVVVARFTPSDPNANPADFQADIGLVQQNKVVQNDGLPDPVISVDTDGTWIATLPAGSIGHAAYSYQVEIFDYSAEQSVVGIAYGQLYAVPAGKQSEPPTEPATPTEPTKPTEPTLPAEPTLPTEEDSPPLVTSNPLPHPDVDVVVVQQPTDAPPTQEPAQQSTAPPTEAPVRAEPVTERVFGADVDSVIDEADGELIGVIS